MRIVVDTNVIVSALVFGGLPRRRVRGGGRRPFAGFITRAEIENESAQSFTRQVRPGMKIGLQRLPAGVVGLG